jgi:hypothetical protein
MKKVMFLLVFLLQIMPYILSTRRNAVVGTAAATGWRSEESEFESWQGQEFKFLLIVQAGFAVHPARYPMGKWDTSPE